MSSKDSQVKKMQRIKIMNPKNTANQFLQKSSYVKTVEYSRTQNQVENRYAQPAPYFASRRELNPTSLVYSKDQIQLPVWDKVDGSRTQNYQQTKSYKYEYNSKNITQSSRNKTRDENPFARKSHQRDRSQEHQKLIQKAIQNSLSPSSKNIGRRPLAQNRSNFNSKRWTYASKADISKIIFIQRWWRYILKNKNIRINKRYAQSTSGQRSKSIDVSKKNAGMTKIKENITQKNF